MQVILHKGGNARDRNAFIADVKFIPGVGPRNAAAIFDGAPLAIEIPPEKSETSMRLLRRMVLDGTLIIPGLDGAKEETAPMPTPAPMPAPIHVNPVPPGIEASVSPNKNSPPNSNALRKAVLTTRPCASMNPVNLYSDDTAPVA